MAATFLALEPGYYWHSWTSLVTGELLRAMVLVRDNKWCWVDWLGTDKEEWFVCREGDAFEFVV